MTRAILLILRDYGLDNVLNSLSSDNTGYVGFGEVSFTEHAMTLLTFNAVRPGPSQI
jgi:hypothetical protein